MQITYDLIRGHTDAIVLARLNEADSYGYQIIKDILAATNEEYELKEATLYTAFRRLEESGLIQSYWGAETIGARRRYYRITPAGHAAHETYKTEWANAKNILDKLIR